MSSFQEPWDESNGPPPTRPRHTTSSNSTSSSPTRRSGGAPPPSAAFTRTSSVGSSSTARSSSGPPRSAFGNNATPIHRTASSGASSVNSAFDDDDIMDASSDSARHDSIRQEALRMLEVADADKSYSVHRTATGGLAAGVGGGKEQRANVRASLKNLSFTASRYNVGKRFSDHLEGTSPTNSREDAEYGEHPNSNSVIDMEGLQQRGSAYNTPPTAQSSPSSAWSSRYSIDSTMLAMSGGSMRPSSSNNNVDRQAAERYAARNLFASSPTKSTGIFGSGYSFRQNFVFGRQNVTANLHDSNSQGQQQKQPTKLKTWQEQLQQKKRQQRNYIILTILLVACALLVPYTYSMHHSTQQRKKEKNSAKTLPADGSQGEITFYVTADGPHTEQESDLLLEELALVSDDPDTKFGVHLGNIQWASETDCEEQHYQDVADMLEDGSPITVFAVPGQEDWNNCPNPDEAWLNWQANMELLDRRWEDTIHAHEFEVYRQKHHIENWAFVTEGVLFIGIHIVNGNVPDQNEFDDRNDANYEWVMGMSKEHKPTIRAVVIFGNAIPGAAQNQEFWDLAQDFWRDQYNDVPVLYVHASSGNGDTYFYQPYGEVDTLWAVQADTPDDGKPLRIFVGMDAERPFKLA